MANEIRIPINEVERLADLVYALTVKSAAFYCNLHGNEWILVVTGY